MDIQIRSDEFSRSRLVIGAGPRPGLLVLLVEAWLLEDSALSGDASVTVRGLWGFFWEVWAV